MFDAEGWALLLIVWGGSLCAVSLTAAGIQIANWYSTRRFRRQITDDYDNPDEPQ